jgi:hypothetical protein
MKMYLILLFVFFGCTVYGQHVKLKCGIVITKSSPYCGGAAPSEQILEELKKKRIPFNEKFYIIRGKINKMPRTFVKPIAFDSLGIVYLFLKAGEYSIIDEFRYKKLSADTNLYDINCLQKIWSTSIFTFTVEKIGKNIFNYNIIDPCSFNVPCSKEKKALPM